MGIKHARGRWGFAKSALCGASMQPAPWVAKRTEGICRLVGKKHKIQVAITIYRSRWVYDYKQCKRFKSAYVSSV